MLRKHIAVCILSFVVTGTGSALGATSSPEDGGTYSTAQLKEMARNAHEPEQYKALAGYYNKQQEHYLQLASQEKKEWARMSQNVAGAPAKYPRPVDSARNLYEYYMYKASQAATNEDKYSRMVSSGTTANGE